MSQPPPASASTNAIRNRMINRRRNMPGDWRVSGAPSGAWLTASDITCRLSSHPAHEIDQRFRLRLINLVAERGHVAAHVAAVHDRIENAFVAYIVVPLGVGEVAGVIVLTLRSLRVAVSAVTRNAVLAIQLRRGARVVIIRRRNHDSEAAGKEH